MHAYSTAYSTLLAGCSCLPAVSVGSMHTQVYRIAGNCRGGKISLLRYALLLCKQFAGLNFAEACTCVVAPYAITLCAKFTRI